MMIWQPSREVWVRPKARSSMSSSSSLASDSRSYHSGSMITWQVEQASEPSQAPSRSMPLRWAISSTDKPFGASTSWRVPLGSMNVIFSITCAPISSFCLLAAGRLVAAAARPDPCGQLVDADARQRGDKGAVHAALCKGCHQPLQRLDLAVDDVTI